MSNRDVMIQILTEVSGKPRGFVVMVINTVPWSESFDRELSDDEAETLMGQLRQEKAGILNWLISGRQKALAKIQAGAMLN